MLAVGFLKECIFIVWNTIILLCISQKKSDSLVKIAFFLERHMIY